MRNRIVHSSSLVIPNFEAPTMQKLTSLGQNEEKKVVEAHDLTLDNLELALADDTKVKLAGLDIDGELDATATPKTV